MVEIGSNSVGSSGAEITVTVSEPSLLFLHADKPEGTALFCVDSELDLTLSCQLFPSSDQLGFRASPVTLEFFFKDGMNCTFEERILTYSFSVRDIESGTYLEKDAICSLNRDFTTEEGYALSI